MKHPSKRWLALLFSLQAAAHAAPAIELAPGEPASFTATPWQYLSFTVNVTGDDEVDPWLLIEPLDVGELDDTFVEGPASTTFTWRVMPGQLKSGILRLRVTDSANETDTLEVPVTVSNPTAPQWWTTKSILTGGTVRDFSPANVGQLKAITKAAYESLKAEYPDLDTATAEGEELAAFVNGFSTAQGNYAGVVQGQAKNAANLVYRAMGAATGKGDLGMAWSSDWSDNRDYAPANIGQIKTLFSFPMPSAGGFNELPELELTSPSPGATPHEHETVAIRATASDSDGSIVSVAFYADGTLLSTDSVSPYEYDWSGMAIGSHVIKAVATDNRGATRLASAAITVGDFIDTPPDVAITGITDALYKPGEGTSGKPAFVTPVAAVIAVSASDPDAPGGPNAGITKVQFFQGTTLLAEDTEAPFVHNMNMTIAPGVYPIKVVAYGESFGEGSGTAEVESSFEVTQRPNGVPSWIDLQEGVVDFTGTPYVGTADTYISNDNAVTRDTNYGALDVAIADDGPARGMLMKFDLTKLANVPVVRGEIWLRINSATQKDFGVYPVLRSWDENTVTWNFPWATPGAGNVTTNPDREDTPIDWIVNPDTVGNLAIADINTALMQSWRDSPSTNYGVIIQEYAGFPRNRLEVWSSEASTPANRPILRVHYRYP